MFQTLKTPPHSKTAFVQTKLTNFLLLPQKALIFISRNECNLIRYSERYIYLYILTLNVAIRLSLAIPCPSRAFRTAESHARLTVVFANLKSKLTFI